MIDATWLGLIPPFVFAWAAAYLAAWVGSGLFVRVLLRMAGQATPADQERVSRVIGKLEDFLVVTLVIVDAYTALAIIFTAKGLARAEMDRANARYYLLGTLGNFAWALTMALLAKWAVLALF